MKTMPSRALAAAVMTALSLVLLVSGCKKSPKAFCKRLQDLSKEDKKDDDKKKKHEMSDKEMEECEKDMTEIKEVSPKGYDCMLSCLDLKTAEATFVCVFTCTADDEKIKEHNEKKQQQKEEEREKKVAERAKLKEKTFDGSVDAISGPDVKFQITLVEGYSADDGGKSTSSFDFKPTEEMESSGPSISVRSAYKPDLDDAVKSAGSKATIVKKSKTDTGYVLTYFDENSLEAKVVVSAGEAKLECDAHYYSRKAEKLKDDLLPFMEKMCSSVKPEFQENPTVLWTKMKTKTYSGAVKNYSDKQASFEITMPEGYAEESYSSETMRSYSIKTGEFESGPSVTVSLGYDNSFDTWVKSMATGHQKITKKEKTDNGYVIVAEGDNSLSVRTMTKSGDIMLECNAHAYSSKLKGHESVVGPWLVKLCQSAKVKG